MDSNETISSFLKYKSQTFVGLKHNIFQIFHLKLGAEWKRFYPLSLTLIHYFLENQGEVRRSLSLLIAICRE